MSERFVGRAWRRGRAAVALLSLSLVAVAGCGSSDEGQPAPSASDSARHLSIGYIPGASLAPAFIAEQLGCLDGLNLTLEFQVIQNPADAIALLSTKKLDAYVGSPFAGMFNQVARGTEVKLVASLGSVNTPGDEPAASGLYGGPHINSVEDLRGKRVGVLGSIGTATSYLLGKSLAEGGLTFADVELVSLSLPDMVPALKNGGIDGALLVAPYTQQVIDQGAGHALVDSKKVYGTDTTSAIVYGESLLVDDRDAGVRYLKAVACAAEQMQGDWRTNETVVKALAEFLQVPEGAISGGGLYAFDPTLVVNERTLIEMQEMFMAVEGTLTYSEILPPEKLIDDSIRAEAVGG